MSTTSSSARRRASLLLLPFLALVVATGLAAPGAATVRTAAASSSTASSSASTGSSAAAAAGDRTTIRTASFNILGSQHTRNSSRYASGKKRARLAVRWLKKRKISVLGMIEAQRDQMRVLVNRGNWRSYPWWKRSTNTETAQSVLWRPGKWKKLRGKRFTIPFHFGQKRKQPMVLLKHKRSGKKMWVVATHYTFGSSKRARRERRVGIRRTIRHVKKLQQTGHPVLLTGDMNSRRRVFCAVLRETSLDAPLGGSYRNGTCRPPTGMRLDWIFGSRRYRWSDFRFADGRLVDRITDHTVPVVKASW